MQWCHGFVLLSMEDTWIFRGGDQLAGADLPGGVCAIPFFSLIAPPSVVALPDVAFAFLCEKKWTVTQSYNCLDLDPVRFI